MKYLLKFIFPFLRSGVEAKGGVEFCHSTRNASRIRQKAVWGTECLNTHTQVPSAYPAVCGIKREADFILLSLGGIDKFRVLIFTIGCG